MSLPKPYYHDEEAGITIYNADCRDILPLLPKVDLVLTSPPYGNIRDYGGHKLDVTGCISPIVSTLNDGSVCVWIEGDQTINGSESCDSFSHAIKFVEQGINLHDTMIYLKDGFAFPEATRYQPVFEYMFVFSNGKPKTFNPIKRKTVYGAITELEHERQKDGTISAIRKRYQLERGNVGNVWLYGTGYLKTSKDPLAYLHPCAFPDRLAFDHIYSWSNSSDLVLDPFLGSGTTAVACKQLHRKCIGIEIEERYAEIAVKRLGQGVLPI